MTRCAFNSSLASVPCPRPSRTTSFLFSILRLSIHRDSHSVLPPHTLNSSNPLTSSNSCSPTVVVATSLHSHSKPSNLMARVACIRHPLNGTPSSPPLTPPLYQVSHSIWASRVRCRLDRSPSAPVLSSSKCLPLLFIRPRSQ